ncbi:hemolysin III family protein [Flavobacteriaceae bacterium]|nr:hemolysin III family protein [Flavobacteriaceae bacterium]MDB4050192.1 hemolysin III family protein [Flavobacteriaceae bacterium]MDB4086529.1 hemolysin III family protein [Flavobacteriaceae bacterium]MDB4239358.1 hemolysin III family protein [Flavobacteriaceae bacterium]
MDQTKKEEFWNTLTHFIGIVLSLVGFPLLIMSNNDLSSFSLVSILFFEFGLLFVYISSTLYHYVDNIKLKKKLRTLDHISIFYLIAGSYAPVCLITLYNHSGIEIFIIVLTIMLTGTFFKLFYTGKYERFSLFLYLAMGWLIVFKINTLIDLISFNGLALIMASGLFYTLGTFFYSSKKIKYSHAIWHLFVLGGSTTHYLFVLFFII